MGNRYNSASTEERVEKGKNGHEFAGVGGNKESVEWLWGRFLKISELEKILLNSCVPDHHFAAVAGDAIAFEAWPPKAPYSLSPLAFFQP
jgi:hypothetical protein